MEIASENLDEFDIHPWWSEFRNVKVEQEFLLQSLPRSQSELRATLAFGAFFYVSFAFLDVAVLGCTREFLILFLARMIATISAGAAIFLVNRRPLSIAIPVLAATAVEIIGTGSFMLITFYHPREIPLHAMALAIMLIAVYLFIPNRLIFSLGVALASTAGFIFIASKVGGLKPSELLTMSMLLVVTNTFGTLACRRYQHLRRDEFRSQSILKREAVRDHLTACYNRRYLYDYILDKEIVRAERYGLWLTVILCDIDNFKLINDTFGHHAGDAVLQTFAALLQKMTRENIDCVIRYGGDEFFLVLPDTDMTGGAQLAERLRVAFAENSTSQAIVQKMDMTASFGVAAVNYSLVGKITSPYALIAAADELLYKAKNAGRNRAVSDEL